MFRSTSEEDMSRMVLTTASTTTNDIWPTMMQSRSSFGSRCLRFTIMFVVFLFLTFFYITAFYCWPNTVAIFTGDHHFYRNQQQQSKLNSKILDEHGVPRKLVLCPEHGKIPRPKHSLPSLMVRPLKNSSQAFSLQSLTVERLEKWFQFVNASDPEIWRQHLLNCTETTVWYAHRETYRQRSDRLRRICKRYGFNDRIFNSWHFSANRRPIYRHKQTNTETTTTEPETKIKYCNTRKCPLLVNKEHRLLTCFVQKIASTSIKHLYYYMQKNPSNNQSEKIEPLSVNNLTSFHQRMNEELYRISPTFLPYVKEGGYHKTIFVRHPFVRLVSAFKDKAERPPEEESYFYVTYWNPLLDRLYGKNRDPSRRVTFKEFVVELLLPTDPYQYDEHWAPIWTRCEPCLVHYEFIGKLETAEQDFQNFQSRLTPSLMNVTFWENLNWKFGSITDNGKKKNNLTECQRKRLKYGETIRYLSQLDPVTIIELYKRYYLDFELFGYTMDELFEVVK